MTTVERGADGHPVYYTPAEDMDGAVAAARGTFRYFWREMTWEMRRIIPGNELSAVKLAFFDEPGGATEHMWVTGVDFDGAAFTGELINQPHRLRSFRQGQVVTIPLDHLSDWILGRGGRAYGAFTVQELRKTMPPDQRRGHDDAWGFDFGDPDRPEVMPYEGGPDVEHPMSVNMAVELPKHLAANPGFVSTPMPGGFRPLHLDALGGNLAQVDAYLEYGADPAAKTDRGLTALDLARVLGWEKVIARLGG